MASEGKTIVFISHKLNEVMEISDKITVMRLAKVTANLVTAETNQTEICQNMVGRDVLFELDQPESTPGEIVFSAKNLNVFNKDNIHVVKDVSLEICEGEIVGIAGVAGNGQDELVEAIVGLSKANYIFGQMTLMGIDITAATTNTRRKIGLAYIPEDRYNVGLALQASVAENLIMGFLDKNQIGEGVLIKNSGVKIFSQGLIDRFKIKISNMFEAAANLSGGNLQELVVGREMHHQSKFLIAEQPTRGVDVGAKQEIHDIIRELANEGKGIIVFSSELPEIVHLCDRIVLMHEGAVGDIMKNSEDIDSDRIMAVVAGGEA